MDKMDIDPIDDGPRDVSKAPPLAASSSSTPLASSDSAVTPMHVSEEEEARQAIDMLRGDDISGRVAAANRLEAVASALGVERTREVRLWYCGMIQIMILVSYYVFSNKFLCCFQCIQHDTKNVLGTVTVLNRWS